MAFTWLIDLPQEIRLRIYQFLFAEPDRILVYRPMRSRKYTHDCSETVGMKPVRHDSLPLAILRTRKEVRREAEPVFFNENVFQICPGCCWPSPNSVVGHHNYLSMHSIQLPSRFVFERLALISTGIFGRGLSNVNTSAYGKLQFLEIDDVKSFLDTNKGGRLSEDDPHPPRSELFLHNLIVSSRHKVDVLVIHFTEPYYHQRNHGFDPNLYHEVIQDLRPRRITITNTTKQQHILIETSIHEMYNASQLQDIVTKLREKSTVDDNAIWSFSDDY